MIFTEQAREVEASSSGAEPLTIQADGQQWIWRYEYPAPEESPDGYNSETPYSYFDLVIPVDTPITLEVGSTDVLHSWWVPALARAVEAVPGDTNTVDFTADEVGTYEGRSTRYSGQGYPTMRTRVHVVEPEEYEAFLEERTDDIDAAREAVNKRGRSGHRSRRGAGRMTPPTLQGAARPEVVSERIPRRRPGWIELVTSADHKSVGRMYIATSLFFAAIALTELVMMRLQLLVPDNTLIRPEIFDRLLSAYGATALLMFALPLAIGLISLIAPLQVGARGVAAAAAPPPLLLALPVRRDRDLRQLPLPPLGGRDRRAHPALRQRVPGGPRDRRLARRRRPDPGRLRPLRDQHDRDAPLRPGAGDGLAAAGAVRLLGDRRQLHAARHRHDHARGDRDAADRPQLRRDVFFVPGEGGAPLLYEHLTSIFLAGAYISVVVAAFGTISEILPTFSRQPHFGLSTLSASFAALAALAVLAWMQNMYAAPIPIGFLYFAMLMALAAIVPVGLILFNWIATLSGGAIRMRAPMLFALGAVVMTTAGLAGELAQSVIPVSWQVAQTGVAWGDTHAALIGAGVLGGFAGLYYWFPKLNGRLMGESLGRASFWAIVVGTLLLVIPTQIAGLQGMPVDVYKFYGDTGMSLVNALASLGSLIFAVGFLLTLVNAASSCSRGTKVGPDPWGGSTLEWFTPSPPPTHNFDLVPDVRSAEPLQRHPRRDQAPGDPLGPAARRDSGTGARAGPGRRRRGRRRSGAIRSRPRCRGELGTGQAGQQTESSPRARKTRTTAR